MFFDDEIRRLVREHIEATRPPDATMPASDGGSLVEARVLDSLGVFSLVGFLESHFEIEIRDEELRWRHFESIDAVTRLVKTKLLLAGSF